jgi:hypothetical protein
MNSFLELGIHVDETKVGNQKIPCPKCSPDRKNREDPCLSVNVDEDVYNCHHCGWKGSIKNKNENGNNGSLKSKISNIYDYKDENEKLLYQSVRFIPKSFRQRHPDCNGGWIWNLENVRRVPFRLPALIASTGPVYIPGGEKDVETLVKHGLTATTNAGGEGNWKPEFNGFFRGRDVVVFEDNDEKGRKHGLVVSESLHGIANRIKIIRFEELPQGGDVSDYLQSHSREELLAKVKSESLFEGSYVGHFGEEVKLEAPVTQNEKSVEDRWPKPQLLNMELLTVQPLPFEILPEPFLPWIKDVSHRMQCPPDFVAVAAITLVGSIIGTRCGIHPKQCDDWLVMPNLWGGAVGLPSTLKTPSLNEALKPLMRLEVEAKKNFDAESEQHEIDLMESQARKEALKADMSKAAKGKASKSMETIKKEMLELEELEKPVMTRYKSNDATIEKLSELLNENPNGLLLFRDELVGLLAGWEKPGRESDRAFFLEAWNGDGSHTTDRIGRGTIFTEHLCLSLFGGIQPSKLTKYLIQSMNGLENDGLIQRLQLLVYPDEVKNWTLVDIAPDREARERAFSIIERLTLMDFTKYGAVLRGSERFPCLRFSDEAQAHFNEWLTELEIEKLRVDDHPVVLEHLGKYRSLMPTLALIDHLINVADGSPAGPVSLQSAQRASAWCEYLESHMRRVYGLVTDVDQQAAAILAEKIQSGKLTNGFTIRDVQRKGWHLLNSRELAQAACDELVDAGWLRVEHPVKDGPGRTALPIHHINPKVKNMQEA